ncbi:Protein gamete expressed 1 [Apostasia shenzhenica]|uniref:Protein gamete expressed 1 n=1 Tax=Apostasia shenzhenica TaxID=1088818 RepID=A0A2I0B4Q5_9ASPA|nr:Protein gamete expressed 1 [Apostasia shenzhenica]
MGQQSLLFLVPLYLCFASTAFRFGFSWPFSSPPPSSRSQTVEHSPLAKGSSAAFSIGSPDDAKAMKLLEKAKRKLATPNTCWHRAYNQLFSSCSEIVDNNDKQERLAWMLSDCFQLDSGRRGFPSCDAAGPMLNCLKKLDDVEHKVFLEFYLETNSICYQLQNEAFRHHTERLVNDLVEAARSAENKLEVIEERSEELMQESLKLHESLSSVEQQSRRLAEDSSNVQEKLKDVLNRSGEIFEQSKEIAASQTDMKARQEEMKGRLEAGITLLQESYEKLGDGMEKLKSEASEIDRQIRMVGESIAVSMQNLQSTADDIGSVAGMSLEKQRQLLEGQSAAMEGLDFLTRFQSRALEENRFMISESRNNLKELAEFGNQQQEELLRRQDQIQQAHDRLIQNSQSILAAQEQFEMKQASIFAALDKLFLLQNALLTESRLIKAFFFYSCVVFLLYILTSAKQTYGIRARLYLGLCITLVAEILIIRFSSADSEQQSFLMSKVFMARTSFIVAASIHVLYSIFTYRDYEMLNHQLLQNLVEKVGRMEQISGNRYLCVDEESERSWSRYSWIEEEELQEEVSLKEDPDYILPEEVDENSITSTSVTRKYNLRPRARC